MQNNRGTSRHDLRIAVRCCKVKCLQIFQIEIFPRECLLERMTELSLRTRDQDSHLKIQFEVHKQLNFEPSLRRFPYICS